MNFELITHRAMVKLDVAGHRKLLVADLTNSRSYPCVLETP